MVVAWRTCVRAATLITFHAKGILRTWDRLQASNFLTSPFLPDSLAERSMVLHPGRLGPT